MKIPFKEIELKYVISTFDQLKKINKEQKIEIPIIGRSNVGKSSLINHLFNNQSLARVSSKPGKTQTINFFEVDHQFFLVDLPGYGFAQKSKTEREKWEKLISSYFKANRNIPCCLVLIDSRILKATELDQLLLGWIEQQNIQPILLATKIDKIPSSKQKTHLKELQAHYSHISANEITPYSIKSATYRELLSKRLEQIVC